MGGMPGAGAHLIVLKNHIHAPVQAVFHRPVSPDRLPNALRVGSQAADIEPPFPCAFAFDQALGVDHDEGFQFRPLLGIVQTLQLGKGIATTGLDPPMVFFDGFPKRMRGASVAGLETRP